METEEPKQSPVLVHGDSQHASEVTVIPCSDKHDRKENGEKVICPYCDFIFEDFTSEIFRDHLQSVHNIHKSLDILVEFSLKAINKGICEII